VGVFVCMCVHFVCVCVCVCVCMPVNVGAIRVCRVGQNHIYNYIYTVYIRYVWHKNHQCTVIYGVYIYSSGQPYVYGVGVCGC
jgi:hypothetical protein